MLRLETISANNVVVHDGESSTLFSYDTPIATKEADGSVTCYTDWNYSQTTGKHRNAFLGEGKADTLAKLTSGEYKLRRAHA